MDNNSFRCSNTSLAHTKNLKKNIITQCKTGSVTFASNVVYEAQSAGTKIMLTFKFDEVVK